MPLDPDSLTIFAEIAIALAGFASLVSVIGARAGGDPPMLDANRLRNLVDTSLFVVGFSLVPLVAVALGWRPEAVWPVACGAYAVCLLFWGPVALARQRRLRQFGIRIRTGWAATLWSVYGAGAAALAWGALGPDPSRAAGAYVLGLMLNLVAGGLIFMLVIASILIPLFQDAQRDR